MILLRGKKLKDNEKFQFFKKLKQFGYSELSKLDNNINIYQKKLGKVFQMRFRPELIDGKIDQECLAILKKLLFIDKIKS